MRARLGRTAGFCVIGLGWAASLVHAQAPAAAAPAQGSIVVA